MNKSVDVNNEKAPYETSKQSKYFHEQEVNGRR